jgi:hypothetical protein
MEHKTIQRFASLFRGLNTAYGTFEITGKSVNGKATGKAKILREPRTLETFKKHLEGVSGVGIVPIDETNQCVWGAIDIDTYPLDHKRLLQTIRKLDFPLVVCRSKSGGSHVYLFLKNPVSAEKLQNKLKEIAAELGYSANTEIFPKQTRLVLERGDVGNFLNLPYFNHENGGLRYAFLDDGTAATLEEFLEQAEQTAITEEKLDSLAATEMEVDQRLKDGPPCLQTLIRRGFPEGTRNNGLFNIGVYLRKAFPHEWEQKILEYNQQINIVADQVKKRDYQYKCADQPICNFCNRDLCRSRRHGVGGGANTPTIANLRKYDSEPPLWFLDVNRHPVELDTESLQKQPNFQRACMEQINFMPRTLVRQAWEAQIHGLLTTMTMTEGAVITTSEDTSLRGQFYDLLEDWTTHMQVADEREEILLRKPYRDNETNRTFFRLKDFEAFLKRSRFVEYKSNKIAQRLRDIDGKSEQLRIGGRVTRVWSIPSSHLIEDDFKSNFSEEDIPF